MMGLKAITTPRRAASTQGLALGASTLSPNPERDAGFVTAEEPSMESEQTRGQARERALPEGVPEQIPAEERPG